MTNIKINLFYEKFVLLSFHSHVLSFLPNLYIVRRKVYPIICSPFLQKFFFVCISIKTHTFQFSPQPGIDWPITSGEKSKR